MENLYTISFGLAGGFGGIHDYKVIKAHTLEEAETFAYEEACEYYEGYVGRNGLRDISDIVEEEGCSEEDAEQIFVEDREDWLLYNAIPYEKSHDELYSGFHFHNPFKE